jgi:hypothetical protein
MSEDKTGGPAFPIPVGFSPEAGTSYCNEGMTLRDYFAGQAITGVMASLIPSGWIGYEDASKYAYRFADAMIQERNK